MKIVQKKTKTIQNKTKHTKKKKEEAKFTNRFKFRVTMLNMIQIKWKCKINIPNSNLLLVYIHCLADWNWTSKSWVSLHVRQPSILCNQLQWSNQNALHSSHHFHGNLCCGLKLNANRQKQYVQKFLSRTKKREEKTQRNNILRQN